MSGSVVSAFSRRHLLASGAALSLAPALPAFAQDGAIDLKAAMAEISYGDPKAKVTVVEYASLACSHCAHFETEMFPTFKKEFIDTGEVRLIFRDFPLNGPGLRAHMLMRCAGGAKTQALKTVIFKNQGSWLNQNFLVNLANIGKLAGVSQAQFDACMASKPLEDFLIKGQYAASQEKQINSTPTFIVNDEYVIAGAYLDQLTEAVIKAGAKRKSS
ncbi:thioredoxin domain-containing protein [Niveispirillum fermenti]|uniref:thioredoxin domain-containing protein n=1 Tax=Niveispirillum fermenti TaxID=1233113 RepID=UPI003A8C195E